MKRRREGRKENEKGRDEKRKLPTLTCHNKHTHPHTAQEKKILNCLVIRIEGS